MTVVTTVTVATVVIVVTVLIVVIVVTETFCDLQTLLHTFFGFPLEYYKVTIIFF